MFMKRIGQLLEAVIRLHGDGIIHRSVNAIVCNRCTCTCNLIKVLSPIATVILSEQSMVFMIFLYSCDSRNIKPSNVYIRDDDSIALGKDIHVHGHP